MISERPAALDFSLAEDEAGERLDVVLSQLSGLPRAQMRRWIEQGRVTVDGRESKPSHRVAVGERVHARPPEPIAMETIPEDIPLEVLYEDAQLIVVDKPAGLVVHPAPGHPSGTLVNALLHHCGDLAGIGGVLRPGIVHRLDRGTSGVMVVAKTDAAHVHLAQQFHDHSVHRVYRAWVRALPRESEGVVDAPIGRHPRDRKRMAIQRDSGRRALTRWQVEERFAANGAALLTVMPETGRTHQIRVHLSSRGMPLIGDPVYGKARRRSATFGLERPALHAAELGFLHPERGETLHFAAPLPDELARLHQRLRANASGGES